MKLPHNEHLPSTHIHGPHHMLSQLLHYFDLTASVVCNTSHTQTGHSCCMSTGPAQVGHSLVVAEYKVQISTIINTTNVTL